MINPLRKQRTYSILDSHVELPQGILPDEIINFFPIEKDIQVNVIKIFETLDGKLVLLHDLICQMYV